VSDNFHAEGEKTGGREKPEQMLHLCMQTLRYPEWSGNMLFEGDGADLTGVERGAGG